MVAMARLQRRRLPPLPAVLRALVPVLIWIFLFSSGVSLLPPAVRPTISTQLLPRVDEFLGNSRTWFRSEHPSKVLDLLAAVPYTVHTALPLAYLGLRTTIAKPARGLAFVRTFGCMNVAAVLTHLAFPTAAPWYFDMYGTTPASYDMKSDPAVLARVDNITGVPFFTNMYREGGKIVFGAWPSLHAAWPYLLARFRPPVLVPAVRIGLWVYAVWVWWAAIYLRHHYLADILGGILYAEVAYRLVARGTEDEPEEKPAAPVLPLTSSGSNRPEA